MDAIYQDDKHKHKREYQKEWNSTHKVQVSKQQHNKYLKTKEYVLAKQKANYDPVKEKIKNHQNYIKNKARHYAISRKYTLSHKEQLSAARKIREAEIKTEVLSYYSKTEIPQCSNPFGEHDKPYTTMAALNLDHIDETTKGKIKGSKKREGGIHFYRKLKALNYPDGYQVLCANCNWIKEDRRRKMPDAELIKVLP